MTQVADTPPRAGLHQCGCCGRQRAADRVAELGQTPGVYICASCALWAARRAGPLSALFQVPATAVRRLRSRLRRRKATSNAVHGTVPILPSTDLTRTAAFYASIGFTEEVRSEQYLVLASGDTELHFTLTPATGHCLVLVTDAQAVWKQLRDHEVPGVGDIADREFGLREFTLIDPNGNQIRIASPLPCD